jgi:signal transduction histidine kinase
MPRWSPRFWPRNLAGRTALLLLVSLTVFHLGSLWMHQHGLRDAVAELGDARVADRLLSAARTIAALPADERDRAAHDLSDPGLSLGWNSRPSVAASDAKANSAELQARLVQGEPRFAGGRLAPWLDVGAGTRGSLPLSDDTWLNFALAPQAPPSGLLGGTDAVASTSVMAVGIVGASLLLVRWLTGPLRRLAQAADGIGRGRVIAVPQDGPEEVQRVARALDAMQARITRLVDDRTQALAAVSHDLRTPITRLRLRAGFLDDRESQARMEADLDEMEGMISATLAYLQGEVDKEPPQLTDIGTLLSTLCDAAADAGQQVALSGPAHFDALCRHVALRRAVSNLIGNAVSYGGTASVRLDVGSDAVRIAVEDSGPGIPDDELERVFEPFHRREASRNRSTGGVGLGLTIARRAVEEQGGTLTLANRPGGGLRAVIRLPIARPPAFGRNGSSLGDSGVKREENPYAST